MNDVPLIRRSPVPRKRCNLARALALIGDRWTLMILRSALNGLRRFDDFQAELGIPRTVLSNRLAALVESGILERRDYREAGQRARAEYLPTRMGRELALPFMAMTQWGDKWLGGGVMPLSLCTRSTGRTVRVAYVDEDGQAVKGSDVEAVVDVDALKSKSKMK